MPPNNNSDQNEMHKLLKNICKLQDDQKKFQDEEHQILKGYIEQMNRLLTELNSYMSTNINVAVGKKSIPFDTGKIAVLTANKTKPTNPDDYPEEGTVNIYALNDSAPIQHMTLINDGPGNLYFIAAYSRNEFNTEEGLLHQNDQRELFNVYEIRLRVTLPLTSYRLMEGTFRTGSFAPTTVANVEVRPNIQSNQLLKSFTMAFDNTSISETFQSPIVQTITVDPASSSVRAPLPRGQTAVYTDSTTNSVMPALIPTGFQAELFGLFTNFSTYFTARGYLELTPGTDIYIPTVIESCNPRGLHVNNSPNLFFFSSAGIDPLGAPSPGRKFIISITNDDPFYSMTGSSDVIIIYSRIT